MNYQLHILNRAFTAVAVLILLSCINSQNRAWCQTDNSTSLKIVYPKSGSNISAPSTFIVGQVTPGTILTCNGTDVRVNKAGFYAHVVPLQFGVNHFVLACANKNNSHSTSNTYDATNNTYNKTSSSYSNTSNSQEEFTVYRILRVIGRFNRGPGQTTIFVNGYSPPYFCLNDGKGLVYVNSSAIGEFQSGWLPNDLADSGTKRADIAVTMLDKFDRYLSVARTEKPFARVWTIKKGTYVSVVGEVVQDKDHNRYVLNAPAFWRAPLLGGQLWLQADNGIKTL